MLNFILIFFCDYTILLYNFYIYNTSIEFWNKCTQQEIDIAGAMPHLRYVLICLFLSHLVAWVGGDGIHGELLQEFNQIPIIDLELSDEADISRQIRQACRDVGFFYIINHGYDTFPSLETAAHNFFQHSSEEERESLLMKHAGKAWRGYFRVGDEITAGLPDQKEGLYFGAEHDPADHRPMHGANLWPTDDGGRLKAAVEAHMKNMKELGERLSRYLALALKLPSNYFINKFHLNEPTELFRIFHYPLLPSHSSPDSPDSPDSPSSPGKENVTLWSVGEHTDYGFITLLFQDASGGLQVIIK